MAVQWLEEEGLTRITGWIRKGLSEKQVAKNMGVSYSTLINWKNKHLQLMQALKKGKEVVDFEIENALHKRAMGFYYNEEKTYIEEVEGKVKKRKEIIKRYALPDTTAQIFWLKNRKPNEWTNGQTDLDIYEQEVRIAKVEAQTGVIEGIANDIENTADLRKLLLGND